ASRTERVPSEVPLAFVCSMQAGLPTGHLWQVCSLRLHNSTCAGELPGHPKRALCSFQSNQVLLEHHLQRKLHDPGIARLLDLPERRVAEISVRILKFRMI